MFNLDMFKDRDFRNGFAIGTVAGVSVFAALFALLASVSSYEASPQPARASSADIYQTRG